MKVFISADIEGTADLASFAEAEYTIKCYHSESHGQQNLIQAFANSCNGAFAEIGLQLNPDSFHALAEQLLFNMPLPYALPYNQSSFTMTGGADEWEKLQTSIGQGKTQITPLHNLLIVSAIANGGANGKPFIPMIKSIATRAARLRAAIFIALLSLSFK